MADAVLQMTAAQRRYRDYLDADWFDGSFMDWCRACRPTNNIPF